jgi:hypothetical protein
MDWLATIKQIAPTVATAFLGPLGGVAVSAVGNLLGVSDATQSKIADAIQSSQMTPEQIGKLKGLELEYKAKEQELGFKYSELAFKDRDSARQANVAGGVQKSLFWMSILLLAGGLGVEGVVLFKGYPPEIPEIIVGRVLGLMDAVVMLVLSYWYGTTAGSTQKNELLAAGGSK